MNDELRMGVIKALYFANALQEYDPDWEKDEDAEPKAPLPKMLVASARTAIVLQLASVFDEGLEQYLAEHFPGQRCDRMKNRIEFLKARGRLEFPDRAERLNALRNRLAHEAGEYATWKDWFQTFSVVGRELVHLGVISTLEAPAEDPAKAEDADESDWVPE